MQQQLHCRINETILVDPELWHVWGEWLPDQLRDEPGDDDAGRHLSIYVCAEFTGSLAFRDQRSEQTPPLDRSAPQPLLVRLRNIMSDALKHTGERHARTIGVDPAKSLSHHQTNARRNRPASIAQNIIDLAERAIVIVLDRAKQQLFLRREVVIDGTLGHSGRFSDVIDARVAIAAVSEHDKRRIEQLLWSAVGSALPAQCFGGRQGGVWVRGFDRRIAFGQ